ncbi:G-protein coupled receptor Mth2 [Holothuria leucospilota]|uniref:G-protein coupled receptor Mth2 n=1 Tax=Holothuria leucospilota TaxID=206669 RepID=A0A9Q0YDT1_HOLLE|nr:G-protein coupled receptor Mth2 [Holothuria leucospilota]
MDLQNQVSFVIMLGITLPSSGQRIQLDTATPTIGNTSVTESFKSEIQICEAYQCFGEEQCLGNEDSFVCSCDKDCALYHDCCWTADGNCRDRIELQGGGTSTKRCRYTHIINIESGFDLQPEATRVGYFMIATCPVHYRDNYVKNRCHKELPLLPQPLEEYIHHVPVFSYKSKETYKNVYCAKCNDVDYEDMRFWQLITATCDSSEPSAECDDVTFIERPEIYDNVPLPRKCALSDPIECSSSSPFYEKCMSYSAVISVMGMTFRNPHCALCYNPGLFFREKEFCSEVDTVLDDGRPAFAPEIPHIVPFDFSVFDEKNVSFKNVTCSRGLFYNSSSNMCDFAPGSTIISVSDCPKISCSEITVRFELNNEKMPMWQSTTIIDTLTGTTNRYFSIPSNDAYSYIGQNNNILLNFRLQNSSETFEEFYQAVNRFSRDIIEYQGLPIKLYDVAVNCSSCSLPFCQNASRFERSQVALFTHEGITSAKIDNLNRVFSDITWNLSSQGLCTDNNTCERNITVIICDWLEERPLCPFRVFTNNSFSLEENENGTLYLLSDLIDGAVPPLDYVILTNGNACVCSEYYKEKVNLIILILSIVFSSLSLVSLVLTFVTYCTFKNLRNLPGKITMNFVVSLFFAQIILIPATFPTINYEACHMIGILGHYLWLSTFLWMSVIAYDVSRTFGMKSTLNQVSNNTKTFVIYFIIGWGVPCVFVIVCVIVQLLHIHNLQFAYVDDDDNCWLSPARANFILFGIPAILCLSFNYINFIFTVRGLHRSQKNAKKVKGQTSSHEMMKQELFLVLKVSILMGLCWIWAILYGFFQDNAVFLYLHSILNPLQGFFVFCIYVCNKRVLYMWRGTLRKLCCQSETKRQYTSSTDSSSRSNVRTSSTVL